MERLTATQINIDKARFTYLNSPHLFCKKCTFLLIDNKSDPPLLINRH